MAVNPETTVRKLIAMPRAPAREVSAFRFEQKIASEAEAFRRLMELGLRAAKAKKDAS